jgi:hypothetical protein
MSKTPQMPETPSEAPLALRTSVLLVTHDCVEGLRRSLAALEASVPRAPIEIIVVDNGSRDGSAQLDAEFPAVNLLRLPKNFGYTKAANIGIRGAKGDYVLLLPPGIEVAPDTVTRLADQLEQNPEVGAVLPAPAQTFALPTAEQLYAEWKSGVALPAAPIGYARDSAILVRRTFLAGMRFFDQRYGEFGAQLDLFHQLRNAGKKVAVLEDVRVGGSAVVAGTTDSVDTVDRINGIAEYAGKYQGFAAGLKVRLGAGLSSLVGFRIGILSGIVGGQKVDGDQPGA